MISIFAMLYFDLDEILMNLNSTTVASESFDNNNIPKLVRKIIQPLDLRSLSI